MSVNCGCEIMYDGALIVATDLSAAFHAEELPKDFPQLVCKLCQEFIENETFKNNAFERCFDGKVLFGSLSCMRK